MALTTTVTIGGGTAATEWDVTSVVPLWGLNTDGEHTSIFDAGMMFSGAGGA